MLCEVHDIGQLIDIFITYVGEMSVWKRSNVHFIKTFFTYLDIRC